MTNNEIQTLIRQKGLENTVELPAEDVQRLLNLQMSYDFVMKYVQDLAKRKYTEQNIRNFQVEHERMCEQVWDHAIKGCMPLNINTELWIGLNSVDEAKRLTELHPSPSWDSGTKFNEPGA